MKSFHALWHSLRSLRGNQRACVMTEPLWAIPNNLIVPFASLYMSAVGLSDAQIGVIASLDLGMQFLWGALSGAIVDKYGRRGTMLVFGLLSWTLPCALWAAAQGYWYFALAVLFNSMWRVTGNSFSCLIVEDGNTERLVHIYTILNIMGLLAGLLSPLAGLFIDRFTLVPTIRVLYVLALGLMTAKFLLQYRLSTESSLGRQKREECREQSLFSLAFGGWPAFRLALRRKPMGLCVLLMVLMTCFAMIQANFWPLFVTAQYGVSDSLLSLFPLVKGIVSLFTYLLIAPRISLLRIRRPLLAGLGAQSLGLALLLILLPLAGAPLWIVFLSAACDAFALALLGPLTESLMSVSIPAQERARINSLIFAAILLISAPAGWLAGQMAELSRALPLGLNLCLVAAEIVVALRIAKTAGRERETIQGRCP